MPAAGVITGVATTSGMVIDIVFVAWPELERPEATAIALTVVVADMNNDPTYNFVWPTPITGVFPLVV